MPPLRWRPRRTRCCRSSGLNVGYPTAHGILPAVRDVTFTVARGEVLGLVGESGSGKSTVLSALMRMLPRRHGDDRRPPRVRGRGRLGPRRTQDAAAAGPADRAGPAAADDVALPGHAGRRPAAPADRGRGRRGEAARAAGQRRAGRAAHPAQGLPVPVLRRPAATDADRRRGAGPRASAGAGRRADHHLGRHRPGADPAPAARPEGPARQLGASSSATTSVWSRRSATGSV